MNEPDTSTIDINGFATRVWRKGSGPEDRLPRGLRRAAALGAVPRSTGRDPHGDRPSLPGFPGGDRGHTVLDNHLDWVLAVRQLIDKADLAGADLVGSSVGGSFAAEVAAIWPDKVKRLALIAPFGLFDEKDPATDPWAQKADDIAGPA